MELIRNKLYTDANLKAYYRLNEDAFETDTKGVYNLTNASVTGTTGKFGYGGTTGTNNTNKRMYIGNDMGITGGAISMSGWFKPNGAISVGETWCFMEQCDAGTRVSNEVYYQNTAGTTALWGSRIKLGGSGQGPAYTVSLSTGVWYHIVYSYDGTNIRLYVNGSLVGGPTAASGNGTSSGADDFNIGARGTQGTITNYSDITFDDVAVFNKGLSASEVSNLYKRASGGFFINLI